MSPSSTASELWNVESSIASRRALSHTVLHFSSSTFAGRLQLRNSTMPARNRLHGEILLSPFRN